MRGILVPFKCIAWLLHIVSMRVVLRGGDGRRPWSRELELGNLMNPLFLDLTEQKSPGTTIKTMS